MIYRKNSRFVDWKTHYFQWVQTYSKGSFSVEWVEMPLHSQKRML